MTEKRPALSVLMPTYQGEAFLALALESVASQTFPDYELLIRDDGSTDRTLALIQSFKVPQFRLVTRATSRRGLFPNLNGLLKEAAAPLCQIFCQDDAFEPTAFEEIVAFWKAHPQIEMLFTKNQMMDWEGNLGAPPNLTDLPAELPPLMALQQLYFHGCIPGNLSTVSFRTSTAWALGGFDESLKVSGDYEFWSRLVQAGPMGILQKTLVRVRGHEGQLSRQLTSGAPFVRENRGVRAAIRQAFPPALQKAAAEFEKKRHNVLDFHLALRLLIRGEIKTAWEIYSEMGLGNILRAAFYWVVTANNRRRPMAPFTQIPDDKARHSA